MSASLAHELAAQPAHHDPFRMPYGYTPTLWICALFVALFGLSTLIHVGQAAHYRLYWLFPTAVLAGIAEVIGWSARLWSSKNPHILTPYLMQISTTIIAPTPLVAANFIILGRVIQRLGPHYSRLGPKLYMTIFLACDFVALIVQAVGGAGASEAAAQHKNPDHGGHIMLGGIAFQMVAITVYATCATEFFIRYLIDRPLRQPTAANAEHTGAEQSGVSTPDVEKSNLPIPARNTLNTGFRRMIFGLFLSTLVIFIRSVYRTIELTNGFQGKIIHTQHLFNWLDGGMITIAMFTLNIFHPGYLGIFSQ